MGLIFSELAPLIVKLAARAPLDEDDRHAILGLPHNTRKLPAGHTIIRAGDAAHHCFVLLSGFAYRSNILRNGLRQILGIHLSGDLIDLQFSMLRPADNNVQALTPVEVAAVPLPPLVALLHARPAVAEAMWSDTLAEMSISKEWIANVGRRDARARIAHLICELTVRQAGQRGAQPGVCKLPMTQEQLGDTLGLTPIHVNRTLRAMDREGLVVRHKGLVHIPDWDALTRAADFTASYLHLPLLKAAGDGSDAKNHGPIHNGQVSASYTTFKMRC